MWRRLRGKAAAVSLGLWGEEERPLDVSEAGKQLQTKQARVTPSHSHSVSFQARVIGRDLDHFLCWFCTSERWAVLLLSETPEIRGACKSVTGVLLSSNIGSVFFTKLFICKI